MFLLPIEGGITFFPRDIRGRAEAVLNSRRRFLNIQTLDFILFMLGNKSMLVVSLSCNLIFKMGKQTNKQKKKQGAKRWRIFSYFWYGSIAASAPYTDKYLLTQMIKATIPGA